MVTFYLDADTFLFNLRCEIVRESSSEISDHICKFYKSRTKIIAFMEFNFKL